MLASTIGRALDLEVPEVEAVRFGDEVCCLSWNFTEPPFELREGIDLTNSHPDDRRVFHIDEVLTALKRYVSPEEAAKQLTYLICFDILIGNPDRHQGNWGVVVSTDPGQPSRMAPFYDNGSAFGSNLDPVRVRNYLSDSQQQERFDNRFRYWIGVREGERARIGDLLGELISWHPSLYSFVEKLEALSCDKLTIIMDMIDERAMSQDRKDLAGSASNA